MTGQARGFRLLGVSGACSRAGKTAVAEALLRALPVGESRALKFTTTDDVFERCPRGTPCVVCDIDVPFRFVDDPGILSQPGTDTARLLTAGARSVWWVIAKRGSARPAWEAVLARLEGWRGTLVMEGSTITGIARPDLRVFVAHAHLDPARWKPGSAELAREADVVVVNRHAGALPTAPAVREALQRAHGGADLREADVNQPLGVWAPDLASALSGRSAHTPSRQPGTAAVAPA